MFRRARALARVIVTGSILALAVLAGVEIWNHYLTGPWTRDGRILAYVVNQAPEVSGRVIKLNVRDNQIVHRGDILYQVDPIDYQVAVANAEAVATSRYEDLQNKLAEARRRQQLTTLSASVEEQQTYLTAAHIASADYAAAVAQLNQARVNLGRTNVVSPVNGYVTNLLLHEGDYAVAGARNLSVLDSDSFWAVGYFEETKIAAIRPGAQALIALMGFRSPVRGHVDSIARGVDTPNINPGTLGLASVDPVFTWVRLAQRIPVRIHIDAIPPGVTIAAGMTATVTIAPWQQAPSRHGLLSRLLTQSGG